MFVVGRRFCAAEVRVIVVLGFNGAARAATTQLPPEGEYVPDRVIVAFKVPPRARMGKRTIDEMEAAGVAAVQPLVDRLKADLKAAVASMAPLLKDVPAPVARAKPMPNQVGNPLEYGYTFNLQSGTDLLATNQQIESQTDVLITEVGGGVHTSPRIQGNDDRKNDPSITANLPPANDSCESATIITSHSFNPPLLDTRKADESPTEPQEKCAFAVSKTVWYRFTTPAEGGTLSIDTHGSTHDTVLSIFSGSCASAAQVACNDDSSDLTSQLTNVALMGNTDYLIKIAGFGASNAGGNQAFNFAFTP